MLIVLHNKRPTVIHIIRFYCNTYHKIDKSNRAEARYDISTETHLHGWGPKLAARYFNMNMNNAYKVYTVLIFTRSTMMEGNQW